MREIKFRAWDKKTISGVPKMIYWSVEQAGTDDDFWSMSNETLTTLMQFTGLKSKSGVEIYEGDIMRLRTIEGSPFPIDAVEVHWSQREQGWLPKVDKGVTSWEIIGNIYENPELLSSNLNSISK